ncbi:MAG TPA: hypothetical protein VGM54_06860 [Chthoniobacter sp.]|jgi:hypothetical protein
MPDPPKKPPTNIQNEIAELVRKELLHIGELQDVEERLKVISEKASKFTPPPGEQAPPENPPA